MSQLTHVKKRVDNITKVTNSRDGRNKTTLMWSTQTFFVTVLACDFQYALRMDRNSPDTVTRFTRHEPKTATVLATQPPTPSPSPPTPYGVFFSNVGCSYLLSFWTSPNIMLHISWCSWADLLWFISWLAKYKNNFSLLSWIWTNRS